MKGKIYKACVPSVMMYGSETWAMKVENTQKLERTEASMMRWMCGVSLNKLLSNEALKGRLGIDYVSDLVRRSRLKWFGHVVRKHDQQWVRKCMDFKVDGSAGTSRPRKSWLECVNNDMRKFGLKKEMAHDRTVRRSAIHGNV